MLHTPQKRMNMTKKKLSESSPQELQRQVKNGDITLTKKIAAEINKLKSREINLSDKEAPEITNWSDTHVGKFYRPIKTQITIRIDADVLDWFKHATKKYQPLVNLACREYMTKHSGKKKSNK